VGTAASDLVAPANAPNVTPVTPEKGTTAAPKSKAKKVAFTLDAQPATPTTASAATPSAITPSAVALKTNPYANIQMNSKAPCFFSKPLKEPQANTSTLRNEPKKFKTFLAICFPEMSGGTMTELEVEIIGYFQLMYH
jgi:hypothetical protein